ncbi:TPR repeat-containing protein [Hymenobacter daecheongensis DSM 21074]|uniref:TPR repeat-containing protein n=1 Tax=Hymenobacter daecheongensis DSM 21074 TaxID=1121955 RepID=A0A1M6EFR0_9BACT|nr:tetratricopeptide repeat protein [Hymenobacter daecheongensis]SHI84263.1 TPR repeat-containing protein [Hymenobacter daecheongensis DSM 21074]
MNYLPRLLPSILLLAAAGALPGCTLPRMLKVAQAGQQITVKPGVLENNGENVLFEVQARVPAKVLQKGKAYNLDLRYRYDNGLREDTLGRLTFVSGEYVYDPENKDQLLITKQFSFPYTPRKNPGELLARPDARVLKPNGKRLKGTEIRLARGIVTTARMVVRQDTALALLPETVDNNMSGTRVLPFFFDAGQAAIRNYLGTNVAALEDFIDANQRTRKVMIVAGHSPDSLDTRDPRLADKRVQALLKYYRKRVDTYSYLNSLRDIEFQTLAYHRRWDLFLNKVQQSALKPAQIDSVILLINDSPGSFARKEKSLHRLSFFDYLEQYIYPVLRFGTVAVEYTAPKRYDSEIYLLSKKIVEKETEADALTAEELRYSATLTPLLAEKQRIYETAVATTGSWQAYHNLAVVLLLRSEKEVSDKVRRAYLRRAATNFTLAAHRNPTADMFYRVATAYHRADDKLEALQNYDYAIKLGGPRPVLDKVFADKAALEIEIGQLDDAVSSLGYSSKSYQNTMNKALIYLLKGNYDGAAGIYQEALALKPNDARAYYSLAVVAARAKDEAQLGPNLRRAIQLDRAFAQRAVEDLEFRDYAGSKMFLEVLR